MERTMRQTIHPAATPSSPGTLPLFVFEPNPRVAGYIRRNFAGTYRLHLSAEPQAFLHQLAAVPHPGLILLAWDGPAHSAALLADTRAVRPTSPIVVLSCSAEMADYHLFAQFSVNGVVLKPFVDNVLEVAIATHLLPSVPKPGASDSETSEIPLEGNRSFVRSSRRMREVEAQANLVARSDIPVLILGESGTGKEVLALYTHQQSRRSKKTFLKVNCAAMPADLLESELFGYEQGAFTGAVKAKPGKFELCDGGTIFLDEIGEMPFVLQSKLLQVLQDGTFSRLGSRAPSHTDVRVIAATNINMKQCMAGRTFREDLYYRLNGLSLQLPPLRERLEEIPALAAYFMRRGAQKYDLQPLPLSPTLLDAMAHYPWPGNLRELENVINRFLILRDEDAILREIRPAQPIVHGAQNGHLEAGQGLKSIGRRLKGETESAVIAEILEQKGWNRKAAASDLQISYKALLYKIKQYELAPR